MEKYLVIILLLSSMSICKTFIIPQEVPSLLSLVYSNIPPIKKGTDSRIGFGYRLGDHADFQVQFEIGPQKETKAIGTSSASKRNIAPSEIFQQEKKAQKQKTKEAVKNQSWLTTWAEQINKKPERVEEPEDSSPKMSQETLQSLQQLYEAVEKKQQESPKVEE